MRRKQGRIRRGVQFGDHPLVRVCGSRRVCAEGEIEDRRIRRKGRTATHDFRKGQVVGPDESHPIVKSTELILEPLTPEVADGAGADHHEHLPGLRQDLQDVLDDRGEIVEHRDRGLVLVQRRVAQEALIDGREEQRRVGKKLPAIFSREHRRGPGDGHDQVRLGRSANVERMKSTTACSGAPTNPVGPTTTWTKLTGPPVRCSRSTRKLPVK